MNHFKETIFALSTSPGKAAVGLIRISGSSSYDFIKKISTNMPTEPNTAIFNEIRTEDGQIIDQTITTFFKAPKSFTGEDMVEISIHGSNAVIKKILNILSKNKEARLAKPGEFTRRAFENNKLDLTLGAGYSNGSGTAAKTPDVEIDGVSWAEAGAKYVSGDMTLTISSGAGKAADEALGTAGSGSDETRNVSGSVAYTVADGISATFGYTDVDNTDDGTAIAGNSGSSWYIGATVSF